MKNQENNQKLAAEWFLKAQDDEKSAEILLKEGGSPNTVCFLAQQMAEKFLKGYLTFKGKKFPKIHELDRLLKLAEKIEFDFKRIEKEAQYLTLFYITTRYPGDYPQFSFKEAKKAFQKALKIKNFVLGKLKL